MCADESLTTDELSAITKKIGRLDKELLITERTNGISSRWTPNHEEYQKEVESKILHKCSEVYESMKTVCEECLFLLKVKEKYAEGHALSKRLANQVKKTDKRIKQLLLEYTSSREQLNEEAKASFQELTIDSAKRHETFYIDECTNETNTAIPSSIKRHAIEMLHLLKRSEEEKAILREEMKAVFDYYIKEEEKVSKSINTFSSIDRANRYDAGSLALLRAEEKLLQIKVVSIHQSFKDCVQLPNINFPGVSDTYNEVVTDDEEESMSVASEINELTESLVFADCLQYSQ